MAALSDHQSVGPEIFMRRALARPSVGARRTPAVSVEPKLGFHVFIRGSSRAMERMHTYLGKEKGDNDPFL